MKISISMKPSLEQLALRLLVRFNHPRAYHVSTEALPSPSKKAFKHFDAFGKPIGLLALVAQVLGKKWWKYKAKLLDSDNPQSWKECLNSANEDKWIDADLNVITNLLSQNTNTSVDRSSVPATANILYSRLLFKLNRNTAHEID